MSDEQIKSLKISFTYLIKENLTNYYKIGRSMRVNGRFKELRTANLHINLLGICEKEENDLHKEFREFHIEGEWFDLSTSPEKEKELISYFVENNQENRNKLKRYHLDNTDKYQWMKWDDDTEESRRYDQRMQEFKEEEKERNNQEKLKRKESIREKKMKAYHHKKKYGQYAHFHK